MLNQIKSKINNLTISKRLKDKEERKKFLIGIGCIALGTIIGIFTYVVCLYANLAIFGWNIGLALSPLAAGYVESIAAKNYLHESTGAVSAFILFIITVIYGFIIANPTLGFNVITAGSLVIIIQAAIPTATNYFLIAMGLGIISHISGVFKKITDFFGNLYSKIFKKEPKLQEVLNEKQIGKRYNFYNRELEMNDLGILILTLEYPPKELNIIEQKSIYEARHIFSNNQREEIKDGLQDYLDENLLISVKLAQDKALLKLIKQLKADGCNGLLNFNTTFETLGSNKGENISQVVVRGTGVVFEEKDDVSSL